MMSDIESMRQALQLAIKRAGGTKALAEGLGIRSQAVSQWRVCPAPRVLDVSRLTGVSRHSLRPDFYPKRRLTLKKRVPFSKASSGVVLSRI